MKCIVKYCNNSNGKITHSQHKKYGMEKNEGVREMEDGSASKIKYGEKGNEGDISLLFLFISLCSFSLQHCLSLSLSHSLAVCPRSHIYKLKLLCGCGSDGDFGLALDFLAFSLPQT